METQASSHEQEADTHTPTHELTQPQEGCYTWFTKRYPLPANMQEEQTWESAFSTFDSRTVQIVVPPSHVSADGSSTTLYGDLAITSSVAAVEAYEDVSQKGVCGCCGYGVMSNQFRSHDGQQYYHQDCWVALLKTVEDIKTSMRQKVGHQQMQNAISRGLDEDKDIKPTKATKANGYRYTKNVDMRIRQSFSELNEEDESEASPEKTSHEA